MYIYIYIIYIYIRTESLEEFQETFTESLKYDVPVMYHGPDPGVSQMCPKILSDFHDEFSIFRGVQLEGLYFYRHPGPFQYARSNVQWDNTLSYLIDILRKHGFRYSFDLVVWNSIENVRMLTQMHMGDSL